MVDRGSNRRLLHDSYRISLWINRHIGPPQCDWAIRHTHIFRWHYWPDNAILFFTVIDDQDTHIDIVVFRKIDEDIFQEQNYEVYSNVKLFLTVDV